MAEFTAKWTDPSQINNGKTFVNIDEVSASDFNALVGNMLYLEQNGMEGNEDMGYFNRVGAIYISTSSTSPASIFGGTWVRIKDRFLLGAGDIYSAGEIGGEANHTLTVAEMPQHEGHLNKNTGISYIGSKYYYLDSAQMSQYTASENARGWVNNGGEMYPQGVTRGGGMSHNNMPPYKTFYMWERTA